MDSPKKSIQITGTYNKYHMNKIIRDNRNKEAKKLIASSSWTFSPEYFEYEKQLELINNILNNNFTYTNEVSKIVFQHIHKKISGYKQQDCLKKRFDNDHFLTFECIINKMLQCKLICRYCNEHMNVLYHISREMKQWSVDRINNNIGHVKDNFHLACLECNLNRKRRSDENYLFTKQLQIIKEDPN
jgi:hypothetical protein